MIFDTSPVVVLDVSSGRDDEGDKRDGVQQKMESRLVLREACIVRSEFLIIHLPVIHAPCRTGLGAAG